MARTQDEIVARYESLRESDFLGWHAEELLVRLDFDHASPYLKAGVTAEDWTSESCDDAHVALELAGYLDFAWGKARDHRGISAERSVDKLSDMVWLLGRDDVVSAIADAGYANYGAPKLQVVAEAFGLPVPADTRVVRMMAGLECRPEGCDEGCSE